MRRFIHIVALLMIAASSLARPIADVQMIYERGAVVVEGVRINGGGNYRFLLDTGSTTCTITPEVAEHLGLRKLGWSTVSAIGATRRLREVKVRRISLGAAAVDHPLTLVAEDNGLSSHVGRKIHGVLGTSFLFQWTTEFDYPAGRFRIHPPEYDLRIEPVEAPWSSVGALTVRKRAAFIKVALNAAAPREMMVDTGATGIVLHDDVARAARAYAPPWNSTSIGSIGPQRKSTYWQLDSVRFAGLTVQGAQAFTPKSFGDWTSNQLGNDALDSFRVTLDTARGLIRLERDVVSERLDGYPWGVGIVFRRDMDAIRVASVWPDSEAAAHGVAPGDVLVSVAGKPAEDTPDHGLRQMLNRPRNQQVQVELRSEDGVERTLTLTSHRYTRRRPAPADGTLATSLSSITPLAPR